MSGSVGVRFSLFGWERLGERGGQRGEANLKGDASHMQQTTDQVLVGRQPVGEQENSIVSHCH